MHKQKSQINNLNLYLKKKKQKKKQENKKKILKSIADSRLLSYMLPSNVFPQFTQGSFFKVFLIFLNSI